MYIYHLWSKMQEGAELSQDEAKMLAQAMDLQKRMQEQEESDQRLLKKRLVAGGLSLAVAASLLISGVNYCKNYFQRPEVRQKSELAFKTRKYFDELKGLEHQAEYNLGMAVQFKMVGNEDARKFYYLKSKQIYVEALKLSKDNPLSSPQFTRGLEKSLENLDKIMCKE